MITKQLFSEADGVLASSTDVASAAIANSIDAKQARCHIEIRTRTSGTLTAKLQTRSLEEPWRDVGSVTADCNATGSFEFVANGYTTAADVMGQEVRLYLDLATASAVGFTIDAHLTLI